MLAIRMLSSPWMLFMIFIDSTCPKSIQSSRQPVNEPASQHTWNWSFMHINMLRSSWINLIQKQNRLPPLPLNRNYYSSHLLFLFYRSVRNFLRRALTDLLFALLLLCFCFAERQRLITSLWKTIKFVAASHFPFPFLCSVNVNVSCMLMTLYTNCCGIC